MKSPGELNRMRSAAVFQFCGAMSASADTKQRLDHQNKRRAVERHSNRFFARMNSPFPYESAEQAIQSLAPVAVWFFGWAARQLAIAVIRFLWDRWRGSESVES
jgi:hypothetical protein